MADDPRAEEETAPVCPQSFYNRRFMKKYLKTVFPSGFGGTLNQPQQTFHGAVKGLPPAKPAGHAAVGGGSTVYPRGALVVTDKKGIAQTKESFMAWARGEVAMTDINDDDSSSLENAQGDALDPFTDVAGPYFHEVSARAVSGPAPRPGTGLSDSGFTDTLHTIQSSVLRFSHPNPPNNYVRELTTREVQIYTRVRKIKGAPAKPLGSAEAKTVSPDRIFLPPSSLPVLLPTTRLQSSLYEPRTPHGGGSIGGGGSLSIPFKGGGSVSSSTALSKAGSRSLYSASHPRINYEEWIEDQKALMGKSHLTFSSSVHERDGDAVEEGSVGDSSVVIKMRLAASGADAVVLTPQSKTLKTAQSPNARNKVKTNPKGGSPLSRLPKQLMVSDGPGSGLDAESSLISDYLLASYEPSASGLVHGGRRSIFVEIHHFVNLLSSTAVYQHPSHVETVDTGFTLQQLVVLLDSLPLPSLSEQPPTQSHFGSGANAANANVAALTAAAPTNTNFRFKKSHTLLAFFYRPTHNDWRPITSTGDWEVAKSSYFTSQPKSQSQQHQQRLRVMFTRNIESDLDDVYQASKVGTDATLLYSPDATRDGEQGSSSTSAPIPSNGAVLTSKTESETGGDLNQPQPFINALEIVAPDLLSEQIAYKLTPRSSSSPPPPSHKGFGVVHAGHSKSQDEPDPATAANNFISTSAPEAATLASMASIAGRNKSARVVRTSDSAQSRTYTSGTVTHLEMPGFPVNPPPTLSKAGSGAAYGAGGAARSRGAQQTGPLKVVPALASVAKQDEMAKWLEQNLLKTRF